jgi:hypothetical protein
MQYKWSGNSNSSLGPNSRRLLGSRHEGTRWKCKGRGERMRWKCKGRGEHMRIVNIDNNYCPGVLSMSTWGLFILTITCGHYNVCNAPVHYPNLSLHSQGGHHCPSVFTIICMPNEWWHDMCPLLHSGDGGLRRVPGLRRSLSMPREASACFHFCFHSGFGQNGAPSFS